MEVELKTDQDGDSFAADRSRSKQISLNGGAAVENDSVSSALATTEGTIAQTSRALPRLRNSRYL